MVFIIVQNLVGIDIAVSMICNFWAIVCKTVRPMLSDRCPVCLSVCSVCNVGILWPTVGWIKMKLGTHIGFGPGHIMLDGDPAPPVPKKEAEPDPNFRPMSTVAKRLDGSR